MRPNAECIRPTPATATRLLRPILTDWLSRAVRLPNRRRICTPATVWRVVLFAAAFARSVAAACAAIPALSGQAIWDGLYTALPKRRRTLERHLLPALHAPLGNRRRAARLAIDHHQVGYFGRPNRDTTRVKEKAGTHTFHIDATACVVGGPGRYTLGLTAVGEKEPFTDVLTRLLDQVAGAGVTARVVLLDEAFFAIAVMRLLQSRDLPFVIPAVIRGRKPRPGVKAIGLRANRLILGMRSVPDGGHEIATTSDLLAALDLAGALVTIDAAGCQKGTVQQIRDRGGDYIVCVKGNQKGLRGAVARVFDWAGEAEFAGCETASEVGAGHGRAEERYVTVVENPEGLPDGCADVGAVALVCREREVGGRPNESTAHYYRTSLRMTAAVLAGYIRAHWGIENSLHWVLDVAFREDESRARAGHAGANLGMVRRVAAGLLKRAGTGSIQTRRMKAAWDEDYMLEVLQGIAAD